MSASFFSAAELANIAAAFWPEEHSFKANVRHLATFAEFNNRECDRTHIARVGVVEIKRSWENVRRTPDRLAAARSVASMRHNINDTIADMSPGSQAAYRGFFAWLEELERAALMVALQQIDALEANLRAAKQEWSEAVERCIQYAGDAQVQNEQISLIGRYLRENVPHFATAKKAEQFLRTRERQAARARENGDTDFFTRPGAIPPIQVVACAKACGYDLKMKSSGE